MPTFPADQLITFARSLFQAAGVPAEEAAIVSGSLVDGNLCGHDSHGLIRIPQYLKMIEEGKFVPGAAFTVAKETPAVLVADGNWGFGQVQTRRLLERLAVKAKQLGVAAGAMKHSGHVGRLGEYAELAAKERLASWITVNNHGYGRTVAPPGGVAGRIGTNPICLGVPTSGPPVVLDIGTSVAAEGKVRVCFNKGVPVPEGWLIDARGKPTTDPASLYNEPKGTIMPLGGPQAYKGFGIGLLMDMFAGGMSGGPCSHPDLPLRAGNTVFMTLYDIDAFAGAGHFLNEIDGLVGNVRTCPRADGIAEVMLPGDPERKEKAGRSAAGITLDDGTWKQLCEAAAKLKVEPPRG